MTKNHRYDIALSFAGEDRDYVEKVAIGLKELGIEVFYDSFEEVELWGKDLYTYLADIYQTAKYTIMFISEHYAKNRWTNHERKAMQARAFEENNEYILPARFDDTVIPGVPSTIGYISLEDKAPKDFVKLIQKKLNLAATTQSDEEASLLRLGNEFLEVLRNLVYQKEAELEREQSQTREKIIQDSATNGWTHLPGHVLAKIDDLQVEAIRKKQDIVWSSLKQTLEAFDPPFYPEMASELNSLIESFFPVKLCKPHDYFRSTGWERPSAEKIQQQLSRQLEGARQTSLRNLKTKIALYVAKKRSNNSEQKHFSASSPPQTQWDLFICHASEDKKDFVGPLANALSQKGISVWYDEFCIKWGDSIRRAIEKGLQASKVGLVVFSHAFFRKEWPQSELDALYKRMNAGDVRILPIWHGITEAELRAYSPLLSGISARTSDCGIEVLSNEIEEVLQETTET